MNKMIESLKPHLKGCHAPYLYITNGVCKICVVTSPCNTHFTMTQNNQPIPYYNPVTVSNHTLETYGVYNNIAHYFFATCHSLTDTLSFNDGFAMGKIEKIPLAIMVCNSNKLNETSSKFCVYKLNQLG